MAKIDSPRNIVMDTMGNIRAFITRLVPLLFVVVLVILLARSCQAGGDETTAPVVQGTESASTTPVARIPLQVSLSDLSSGAHLLAGQSTQSVAGTSFGLIMLYQPPGEGNVATANYYDVQMMDALDADGDSVARFGSEVASLVLALDATDFDTFIKKLPHKQALYLVPRGTALYPTPQPMTIEASDDRVPLHLSLGDLSSGAHLLIGQTTTSLAGTYFGLTMLYQPPGADNVATVSYHDVQVIDALDVNGDSVARFGSEVASLVLELDAADFDTFIAQLPHKQALHLSAQGTELYPPPTAAPSVTLHPIAVGEVVFDLSLDETFKSDVKQFAAGDKVVIIISTQTKDPDGNVVERQSAPYEATVANILDGSGMVVPAPPYKNATTLRISLSPGVDNLNAVAFANDLSGATAIYLIK